VSDNGTGMDEATLKRAFEPFFTTKEIGKGTGLGLATVFGIVKQHQGWIDLESKVGEGTVFRIFLPARAAASAMPASIVNSIIPRGQETILVVEDNDLLRELTLVWLQQLGYRVLAAANGVEALKCWNQHGGRINLLLTDMVMPEGMSGLELAEQLRQMNSTLKVIVTSGYSLEIARRNAPAKRGVSYLSKPYEGAALATAVRDCLDQA
jgi:CheY-like chemotaxis protein